MVRYKLTIEYDGGPFVGWQIQGEGRSVQGELTAAIERFTGERVDVRGAGRTDTGVHALGQVAHVDLSKDWPDQTVREAINAHLRPAPIAVLKAEHASPDFDARFSAVKRHYRYRILNRRAGPALERGRVWHVAQALDVDAMHAAAQALVGRHDFTTFRAAQCQAASPEKTLDRLVVRHEGEEVVIEASARSFLMSQVRSFAGSLKLVGEGRWSPADLKDALEAKDRARCGALAPPEGLYLVRVEY
jgi:tRNA pseudouridine38-40 synthase